MIAQGRRLRQLAVSSILVIVSAAGCRAASRTFYEVRVELSTTSEWAELRVEGADFLVDWWAPENRINGLHVFTAPAIRLEKPCCLETPVTVKMDLQLFPSDAQEISWILAMSSYGRSSLKILAMPDGEGEPVELVDVILRTRGDAQEGPSRTSRTSVDEITTQAAAGCAVDSSSPTYAEAESHLDIEYAALSGVEPALLSLDLLLPARDLSNPPPLVVFIHGGGMFGGDKQSLEVYYNDVRNVIGASYAVASVNYRLMPDAQFPAQLQDVRGAIQWLRAHADTFGYDGGRIALWGFSSGGCLALLAGLTEGVDELAGATGTYTDVSTEVSAICSYYGTADFRTMTEGVPWAYLGCEQGDADFAAFASPVSHVSSDDPPVFLLHGTQDPYLPVEQAESLYALLQEAGVVSELVVVRGDAHGGQTGWWGEGPRAVRDFLDAHLYGD
jgi:acetyl esterase/lipase